MLLIFESEVKFMQRWARCSGKLIRAPCGGGDLKGEAQILAGNSWLIDFMKSTRELPPNTGAHRM